MPLSLALALLVLGTAVDFLFDRLEVFYREAFKVIGFPKLYDQLSEKVFDVKVLTLILLNAAFCLMILLSLFRDWSRRRITLWVYGGLFFLPLLFALAVKLAGDDPALRHRSRAIIDYVLLTPLPVVFLTPLLVLFKVPESGNKKVSQLKAG
ncbi:XrtX-associated membrane protein [Rufibacter psychrotolerans]|uniref:XrtX-associated membrane protein n=1 Tax=Rufibacter psychrotolerans TaxID=2812556 RepID=UPI0019684545|nr:hypothetical protein [Rufibacter sp. SYSU D00308]